MTLRRPLDREKNSQHTVHVIAKDGGMPAFSVTATVHITVSDVNDNAPHIDKPKFITLEENSGPQHLADIILDDLDDWRLGNGPPFNVVLDENADKDIKNSFSIKFESSKYC